MSGIDRRGEWVAVLGLLVSLIGALVLGLLGVWSQSSSSSVWGAAFQMFGATGIWLLCYVQLHQQRLLAEERLEIAELERQRQAKLGGVQTIFEEEDLDQMDNLTMGRRLRSIERFLIPVIALAVALFHLAAGICIFPWIWQFPPIAFGASLQHVVHAEVILCFTGGIAFVTFMVSRYALGMSRMKLWGPLRAGGNFTFGSSAICLAISIALLCEISGLPRVETWLGRIIGFLLIIFAAETIANYILDFYRPRAPGQPHRPFYDSRLLGMFSEPGGILRSLANAIDYQFGFKVSETWFYQLMGRAILPLLLVQILVLLLLTCIVVVPPGHQAVIEHFGKAASATLKPGVHLTWSWPIDRASIIPVERIRRMVLGHVDEDKGKKGQRAKKNDVTERRHPILWTKKHFHKEYKLLVADRLASADSKVPVNLLSVSMPVQWRVKHQRDADVIQFYSQARDAAPIVESLAYRELTRYAASADITDLLGRGGIAAAVALQEKIQKACDRAGYNGKGLGVEIVYVGIGGVHPPPDEDVAKAYQDVVSAYEKKDAKIKKALGEAAKLRIMSGGIGWEQLKSAIDSEDRASKTGSADLPEKTAEVTRLLRSVSGGLARAIAADAEKRAYGKVFGEKALAEQYIQELSAYNAAPKTYMLRLYLRTITESLKDTRKYVIIMKDPNRLIYELDLKPPQAIDVLGSEISAAEQKSEQP